VRHLPAIALSLVLAVLAPEEATASGSSSDEIVRGAFRLALATPSIKFESPRDEYAFHGEFRHRSAEDAEWLAGRVQAVLDRLSDGDKAAIGLVPWSAALPEVDAWVEPGEPRSLEAVRPPVRWVMPLAAGGQARWHVPDMTMVTLELAVSRPDREALGALRAAIEAELAREDPSEARPGDVLEIVPTGSPPDGLPR
jgi:hypothetical protein